MLNLFHTYVLKFDLFDSDSDSEFITNPLDPFGSLRWAALLMGQGRIQLDQLCSIDKISRQRSDSQEIRFG